MVYKLPQTYPFACPQAKQTDSLSERGLKTAGTYRFKTQKSSPLQFRKSHLKIPNHKSTLCIILA